MTQGMDGHWSWQGWRSRAIALCLVLGLIWGLGGCGDAATVTPKPLLAMDETPGTTHLLAGDLAEVSPPETIQQLKPFLDVYEPQVRILAPQPGQVLNQTTVAVQLRVRDLPIYKDAQWELGPHLHLFLDDRPILSVADPDQDIVLEGLSPGSHTVRVVAVRPWGESFKNEGAFAQVTFDVFTSLPQQQVAAGVPQLTYNLPQGSYGAEPILLDFLLRDVPLHLVATEDEAIADWRLRCTVNGNTFVFDRWQPIYLTGFQPGQNWIKLELIDETGQVFNNPFNTAVRVIEYQPGGDDSLSQLIRGDHPWEAFRAIVDPAYTPVPEPEPATDTPPAADSATPEPSAPAAPAPEPPAPDAPEPPLAEEPQPNLPGGPEGNQDSQDSTPEEEQAAALEQPSKQPLEEPLEQSLEQLSEQPVPAAAAPPEPPDLDGGNPGAADVQGESTDPEKTSPPSRQADSPTDDIPSPAPETTGKNTPEVELSDLASPEVEPTTVTPTPGPEPGLEVDGAPESLEPLPETLPAPPALGEPEGRKI